MHLGLFACLLGLMPYEWIKNLRKLNALENRATIHSRVLSLIASLPPIVWIAMLLSGFKRELIMDICHNITPINPVVTALLIPLIYFLSIVAIIRIIRYYSQRK